LAAWIIRLLRPMPPGIDPARPWLVLRYPGVHVLRAADRPIVSDVRVINWPEAFAYLQSCPPGKAREQLLRLAMGKCRVKAAKPKIRLPRGSRAVTKSVPLPKLKKELDRVFSIVIRTAKTDLYGWTRCVTCGRQDHWKKMDAGHYVPRQDLATRWVVENVWPQCKPCNGFRGGEPEKMAEWIDKVYGIGAAAKLREQAKQPFKLSRYWLTQEIVKFKAMIPKDAE
jgi:5-methylcytosine-specific restriction endonuclease McrA